MMFYTLFLNIDLDHVKKHLIQKSSNKTYCLQHKYDYSITVHLYQRWSPRGHILKSLASKVKSLALASRPQVLENWPVLGSRTAVFFKLLKFCGAHEKFFGIRFFVEIA